MSVPYTNRFASHPARINGRGWSSRPAGTDGGRRLAAQFYEVSMILRLVVGENLWIGSRSGLFRHLL